MVILKIFTCTPNLTSNFETHKNVGDNFYLVYKQIYILYIYPQSMKKIEGGKISAPIQPPTHPRNKTFSRFQKRGFPPQKRRCPVPFLEHIIKWKDRQWTPSGSAFADSLRGIKHFQDFRNVDFNTKNEDAQSPFWNT